MKSNIFTTLAIVLTTSTIVQSRRWFASEVSCWITHEKTPATWADARRHCQRHGAVLASPLNTQLLDYMQSLVNAHNHSAAYFIGTRAKNSNDSQEVHYVSVEGRRLDEMPRTVFDAIDQLDLSQGECLSMDRRGIHPASCWDRLPYICYSNETTECGSAATNTSVSTTNISTSLPTSTIPPGYKYYNATKSFYKVHHDTERERDVTWDVANATCASEGAQIVVFNNAEEVNVVVAVMAEADFTYTWTGLQNSRPAGLMDWRTVYGEPISEVFHAWGGGYPTNKPGWNCAAFYATDKRLFNLPCGDLYYKHYFVCEISQ